VNRRTKIILGLILAFLAAFLFYPLLYVFKEALLPEGALSLEFFRNVVANPITRRAILNSLLLATTSTFLTIVLALPLAFASVRYRFPWKGLLTGLLLVPMVMPPFVGAIGMRRVLARFGSLNLLLMNADLISSPIDWLGAARFWGVVIVEVLHLYPIMYLNVAAALANIDPSLEEAATNLGSNGWRRFRRVTLPLMMPGLFAGSTITFIWSFTDLGTPLVFEYRRVIPVQIFDRVTDISSNPEGYALVVLVIVLTLVLFLSGKRLFGLKAYQTLGKGGVGRTEKKPGAIGTALILILFLGVTALACIPHASVLLSSLQDRWFMTVLPESYTLEHYAAGLSHDLTLPGIRNSILFSSMSTVVDVVLGVVIAYVLVRKRFRGADLLDAIVMLPLAIPGIVLAFGYLASFAGTPLDPRVNPVPLLVIAYAVRRLPYMVRAAYAGFQQISVTLEEAAVNLGSSTPRVMRRITLPLLSANLIAGGILAFSFAMLEVSDSLILAMKEQFYPITKVIYSLLSRIEDGPYIASALGVWAMVFLALSLLMAGVLLGRRMGQLFRA
jgi:iron(III) transport system permease protein